MPDQRLRTRAGLLAVMIFAATAARARPLVHLVTPGAPRDIVVTAPRAPTEQEVRRQGRMITRGGDFYHEPLARFEDPVCPGISGLPVAVASLMVDRIRYDAERVGAPLDKSADCKANIVVAFVRNGATAVRELLKTKSFLFAGLETAEANEIDAEAGPVRAWNTTVVRTRFGEPESPRLQQGPVKMSGSVSLGPVPVTIVPSSDSHIYLASRLDIASSVIVIDVAAIDGLSVDQIADYAAMRALARTRPARVGSPAATILSLFDPTGPSPAQMTTFDLAYLRSLYNAASNVPAVVKIGGISRAWRRDEDRLREARRQ